ncbi:MAG TPA: Rieske (2Fe-2S) protein [Chloroflexota bacterium]|nr:Rieske (2Fe-2S) protein [Chloroflexota bacterium]
MAVESIQQSAAAARTLIPVCSLEELRRKGCVVVSAGRHGVAVFYNDGAPRAVDNRCPHMGFPLSRGSVAQGILTCHWHHARFDLQSGGTFDPFADDVRAYPVHVQDSQVLLDPQPADGDYVAHWKARLGDGLEQNLSLIVVKAVLALQEAGVPASEMLEIGGRFGTQYREAGWGPGLTILTALANTLETLAPDDRALALYHGLVRVAGDCAGAPPRFSLEPLPNDVVDVGQLRAWFRGFAEVRDVDGCERTLLTAIRRGATPAMLADMLLAAATDHFFLAGGHTVDFINKAGELLDHVGWQQAAEVLPSVIRGIAQGQRSEEQNAWRHPIDIVALLEPVFQDLPALIDLQAAPGRWTGFTALSEALLADEPQQAVAALLAALRAGATVTEVSQTVAYAAALRVARFHTSNEFGDWITVLHTFTYCNALDQGLRRAPSVETARGIFHGAMKLYLDRFLNMPAARLPRDGDVQHLPDAAGTLLAELAELLDREQQVNQAGAMAYRYLSSGHDPTLLLQTFGHLLLREDGEFHSYQMFEAGLRQHQALQAANPAAARTVLVAVARYLAAHSPTSRAMLQTARSAWRLQRGEELYVSPEGEEAE